MQSKKRVSGMHVPGMQCGQTRAQVASGLCAGCAQVPGRRAQWLGGQGSSEQSSGAALWVSIVSHDTMDAGAEACNACAGGYAYPNKVDGPSRVVRGQVLERLRHHQGPTWVIVGPKFP